MTEPTTVVPQLRIIRSMVDTVERRVAAMAAAMPVDHVYHTDGGWFFTDHDQDSSGPFATEQEARVEEILYVHYLTTGVDLRTGIIARWASVMGKVLAHYERQTRDNKQRAQQATEPAVSLCQPSAPVEIVTFDDVLLARKIACGAHQGQVEKFGLKTPYFKHVCRVRNSFGSARPEAAVAYLHDVLEDCPVLSTAKLLMWGVPSSVVRSVAIMTRNKGEDYAQYIARVAQSDDKVAIAVKIADLRDHLRPMKEVPGMNKFVPVPLSLRERYQRALEHLEDVQAGL